jgi:membrane associated rhomboid family serine protease
MKIDTILFIQNREISIGISIFLILVFISYHINLLNSLPCNNNFLNVLLTNFIHIDPHHLLSNLYSLFALSKLESEIGKVKYSKLLLLLLFFTTLFEYIYKNIIKNTICSIGFSGILFGLFTYDLVAKKGIDINIIFSMILMLYNSSQGKNISNVGHIFGIFAGLICAKILR